MPTRTQSPARTKAGVPARSRARPWAWPWPWTRGQPRLERLARTSRTSRLWVPLRRPRVPPRTPFLVPWPPCPQPFASAPLGGWPPEVGRDLRRLLAVATVLVPWPRALDRRRWRARWSWPVRRRRTWVTAPLPPPLPGAALPPGPVEAGGLWLPVPLPERGLSRTAVRLHLTLFESLMFLFVTESGYTWSSRSSGSSTSASTSSASFSSTSGRNSRSGRRLSSGSGTHRGRSRDWSGTCSRSSWASCSCRSSWSSSRGSGYGWRSTSGTGSSSTRASGSQSCHRWSPRTSQLQASRQSPRIAA